MSASSKNKMGIIVVLLIALCAAGYFFGVPMIEKMQASKIAEIIYKMPGDLKADSIHVGLFDKKVTITGLKGVTSYFDGTKINLDIESITGSGLNLKAAQKPGVMPLADSVQVKGLKTALVVDMQELSQPVSQDVQVSEMNIKGMKGDMAAFMQWLDARKDEPVESKPTLDQYTSSVFSYATAVSSFAADEITISGYAAQLDINGLAATASLESIKYKDVSLYKYGPSSAEGFKLNYMNSEIMSIERCSSESFSFPNLIDLMKDAETNPNIQQDMIRAFTDSPMILKGVVFEKVAVNFISPEGLEKFMPAQTLTLDRADVDMEVGTEKLIVKKDVQGLVIPALLLGRLGGDSAAFAAHYNKPLELDGKVDLLITQAGGSGDIWLNNMEVKEKNLGEASLAADFLFKGRGEGLKGLLDEGADVFLRKSAVTLEDKSLLENVLGAQSSAMIAHGQLPEGFDPNMLRESIVRSIASFGQVSPSQDAKLIIEGLAKLAAAPGVLKIAVNPPEPVSLDELEADDGQLVLNATVEYVPAQR